MRVDMTRPGELHRLIQRFLDYELPEINEFRQARQQFTDPICHRRFWIQLARGYCRRGRGTQQRRAIRMPSPAFWSTVPAALSALPCTNADVREMLSCSRHKPH